MIIRDHLLAEPPDGIELEIRRGVNSPYPFKPEIAVIHYGVTHTLEQLIAAQKARGFYAHVSIDGASELDADGEIVNRWTKIIQSVPFNLRALHCGVSDYQGKPGGCNAIALGIEISNPGPLIRHADGVLRTVYRKAWPVEKEWPDEYAIAAQHKSGRAPKDWTHWAAYSEEEVDLVIHIVTLWKQEYGIVDVVGHDDIAPTRKFDPGPAFPMDRVRETVFS